MNCGRYCVECVKNGNIFYEFNIVQYIENILNIFVIFFGISHATVEKM